MLRASIHTSSLLAISLLTPACDDMADLHDDVGAEEEGDDDGDADDDDGEFGGGQPQPRCVPSPCEDPPLGNTNWVGSNPIDTVTQDSWNVVTELSNGRFMRFTGASCPAHAYIWKFNATALGELVFWKSSTGGSIDANKIRGLAVQGCSFHAQFSDFASFASPTSVTIKIKYVESSQRADGATGFKYVMTVMGLNTDQPEIWENEYPTCYDNADAPNDYFLQVRPGLALDTETWQLTADSTKQSWVCAAGAFGHFASKNVNLASISDPVLGTTEGRAWGLYHHGASHTQVGNPIRIHHPTIAGYDAAPDNCAGQEIWWREALWSAGGLLCRGSNGASWADEINRNAFSRLLDWDSDTSVADVSVCNGTPSHDFETYAQCYMNGSLRICPPSPC
jgi:hypothetical protein